MDLGFKVKRDHAIKADVAYKNPPGGVLGTTHNGYIRPDIQRKLADAVIREVESGQHLSDKAAITAVYTAFWKQWAEAWGGKWEDRPWVQEV